MNKPPYKILSLFALCICLILGCSKSKNSPRVLSASETQLLGTWYVTKQIDTQLYYVKNVLSTDTSQTYYKKDSNFTTANYITFKSALFSTPSALGLGNLGLQCIDASYGLSTQGASASLKGTKDSVYWFYDDDLDEVDINGIPYYIQTIDSNTLVLYFATPYVPAPVQENYNWCYLKK